MKITFLVPPSLNKNLPAERVFGCNYGLYPLPNIFVLYVASLLEKNEFEVKYVDGAINKWNEKKLIEFLENDDSDIYSLYTVFLSERTDKKVHKLIRRINKNIPVVFFGPQPTHFPKKYVLDEMTYAVRGEPEYTYLDLMEKIRSGDDISGISGISYMEENEIINNPTRGVIKNLDDIPFPARHILDKKLYHTPKLNKRPFTVMITSRGCSHRCYYCVPCSESFSRELEWRSEKDDYSKPPVGLRSPENIIKEFKHLKEMGYKSVSILDDQFVWGEERTIKICEGIKDLGIEWGCLSRTDHLNERIVESMARAGCRYVDVGVESFNQDVLNDIKKDMRVETIFKGINLLKKYGIHVKLNMLLGVSPLQTKEVIENDIEISKKIGADMIMFGVTTPFPGTEFHDIALKRNWIKTGDYVPTDPLTKSIINYPNLSDRELRKLLKKANRSFYLRPKFLMGKLLEVNSFHEFKKNLKSLMRLLK